MSRSSVASATDDRTTERALIILTLALGAALVLRLFVPTRDPWIDEAMLGLNIKAIALGDLFRPLPYFEQAAPPGYLALCYLARSLVPDAGVVAALRGVSVVLMIGTFYLLLRLAVAYGGLRAAVLLAAFVLSSDFILSYGVELKHYAAEMFATAAILVVGRDLARSVTTRSCLLFFAVASVASILSFTAPIPVAAVLGSTFVLHWWRSRRLNDPAGATESGRFDWLLPWSACAFLTLAFLVLMKKVVTDPLTALQFSAYPGAYNTFLNLRGTIGSNAQILEWLVAKTYEFIYLTTFAEGRADAVRHAGILVATVVIIALNVLAARKSPYLVLTGVMLFGVILILNVVKLFPIAYTRHLLFATPILIMPVVLGTAEFLELVGRRVNSLAQRVSTIGVYTVLLMLASLATYRTVRAEKAKETRLLQDAFRMDAASPVWVYFGAQPTVKMIPHPDLRFIGMLDTRSGAQSWLRRGGVLSRKDPHGDPYLDGYRQALNGQNAVWLLFTHTTLYVRPEQSLDSYLQIAESLVGTCKLRRSMGPAWLYRCSRLSSE